MTGDSGLPSLCLSFLDPWSRVVQLHQPVHDEILSSAAASRADPDESPSAGFHFSSDMLRCELAVAPDPFSGTSTQDNLH